MQGRVIFNHRVLKKSHTCEEAQRDLSNFHLIMNLKNNHFLGLKYLHTSIFITIMSYYNANPQKSCSELH